MRRMRRRGTQYAREKQRRLTAQSISARGGVSARPELEDQFKPDDMGNERKAHRFGLFGRTGTKNLYRYDFGHNWEHRNVLEKRCHPLLT
jgi:hypothetical protein